jgi:hypothetical protein
MEIGGGINDLSASEDTGRNVAAINGARVAGNAPSQEAGAASDVENALARMQVRQQELAADEFAAGAVALILRFEEGAQRHRLVLGTGLAVKIMRTESQDTQSDVSFPRAWCKTQEQNDPTCSKKGLGISSGGQNRSD